MKTMKRRITAFILAAAAIMLLCLPSFAEDAPELSHTSCAYLYNITSSTLLYSKNPDIAISPGPTAKLMAIAIIIDALGDNLNREITITKAMLKGVRGNNINLQENEIVTVLQLLSALIVGNSNDAAHVLANVVAGSIDAFVVLMNQKAKEIGAVNTVYMNPTGIFEVGMTTTISDTAKVALYLYKYNIFREIACLQYYILAETNESRERKIYNRNWLINTDTEYIYYARNVNGMGAGYTDESGYCLAASSYYNNTEYLCVIMGAEKDDDYYYSFKYANDLLYWAYENFTYMTVLKASEIICEVPVALAAKTTSIALMPEHGIDLYLPKDTDLSTVSYSWALNTNGLTAPVEEGEKAGVLTVLIDGDIAGQVDLVTKSAIPLSDTKRIMSIVENFISSFAFKLTASLIAAAAVIYILINSIVRYRRELKRSRKKKSY